MFYAFFTIFISFFTLTYWKYNLSETIIISYAIGVTTILIQVEFDLIKDLYESR